MRCRNIGYEVNKADNTSDHKSLVSMFTGYFTQYQHSLNRASFAIAHQITCRPCFWKQTAVKADREAVSHVRNRKRKQAVKN